ncbi:hypothetical protein MPTK1_2g02470 [Marchantia polymorpha subsp. ruderalis]|uniref:Uncharacterized protein n=1 Tax=Marchantia polymorpha TaxID=3197 RepID=A0A2R6WM02_MARPO|nr:hypothetical protein MARPO_0075s0009 [Marchantia polymorpha]BBN00828.1 hypothetical protein Mp_2g02470 [Marchantia polymorpha subsp. ruderalis]|eukprot:PTQ34881.1 hypothetical protein MARPO_0075s0009 [Marchantia polymorpha]
MDVRLIELSFGWLIIRADSEHTRSKKNSTIGTGIIVLAPLNLCTLHLKKTPALKAVLKDYLEDEHRAALSIRRDCTRRSVALPSRCMETDQGACNGLWIGPESQSQTETWSPRQSKKMQRAVGRQVASSYLEDYKNRHLIRQGLWSQSCHRRLSPPRRMSTGVIAGARAQKLLKI